MTQRNNLIDMNKTELLEQKRQKHQSILDSINDQELSYLRGCMKREQYDTEWYDCIEDTCMIEVGVGVDCEEFTIQVHVSVELIEETETNYSQVNITDILIDGVLNFEGEHIAICEETEQAIINKLK